MRPCYPRHTLHIRSILIICKSKLVYGHSEAWELARNEIEISKVAEVPM